MSDCIVPCRATARDKGGFLTVVGGAAALVRRSAKLNEVLLRLFALTTTHADASSTFFFRKSADFKFDLFGFFQQHDTRC
jgi:cellulose synthase/poly-beta-1,6-N-acetylglucosamine synthase-like glycosyltransferase